MPHGSGHGSHGGGHHSSSHHGGRGSSGSRNHVSRRPFRGSRRYRYYDRMGNPRYVYSRGVPRRESLASLIVTLIFLSFFMLAPAPMFMEIARELKPPKPLVPKFTCEGVHIEDKCGYIDNSAELEKAMKAFETTTGICPRIVTAHNSDWMGIYKNPEEYALRLYTQRFSDEQHFLIVYSEPENADRKGYVNWYWGGAQGDETDRILTTGKVDHFFDLMHNYLDEEKLSTGECFERTFTDAQNYIMEPARKKNDSETIFVIGFIGVWILVIAGSAVTLIKSYLAGRRNYEEVPF